MTQPPNWTDDILGKFDVLDKVWAWLTFALAPAARRTRRLDLVTLELPYNADVSLNQLIAHLNRYGIVAVRSGFDSRRMTYQIRRSQLRWHNARVRITHTTHGPHVELLGGKAWAEQPRRKNGRWRTW